MWAPDDSGPVLFISGTASIVGHETLHAGNAAGQARETVVNLLAVMNEAGAGKPTPHQSELWLKAYVRDPQYLPAIRHRLRRTFGRAANIVYLHADICRSDLLLEVEASQSGGAR